MKRFAYADDKIGGKEIMIAVPSMIIGGGMLTLPNLIAKVTIGSDGWLLILAGGILVFLIAWLVTKLAIKFPNEQFIDYASAIITRPIAICLTFLFSIIGLLVAAYVIRNIANTSKEYLFEQTPVEVISLIFLLVVIYAIASSRIGLFRLNMLFFPFLFFIIVFLMIFSIKWFDFDKLLPVFETNPKNYVLGINSVLTSYVGIFILLFYLSLMDKTEEAPKMVAIGICVPILLYLVIFIFCIGVFGHAVTADLYNPTVELAKRAEIPGGVLERLEVIFYVVWMMTIFNTASMSLDIAVMALQSIFKKTKKMTIIFVLSPLTYMICMLPENYVQLNKFGSSISYLAFFSTVSVTILLLTIAKIRGVDQIG